MSRKTRFRLSAVRLSLLLVLFCLATVGCGVKLPEVKPNDEPLRTESDGVWVYNVYNNYIGVCDYIGDAAVERLVLPDTIEGLPTAKLERNFLAGRSFDFHEIVLPKTIVRIEDGTLCGTDPWLEKINIPKSVSYIGSFAFGGSRWLEAQDDEFVIVGDGVLIAYNGSGGDIELPSRVKVVSTAFSSDKTIASVRINSGCRELTPSAFAHSTVREVWIPDSVERIGSDCFRSNSLVSARMPAGSCEIGKYALESSAGLVLTVSEDSDSLLYAVEKNIPFRIEGSETVYHSDYIEAVGAGDAVFTQSGEIAIYRVNEQFISEDSGSCVIPLDENGDGICDAFCFANLRTRRITDRVELGEDSLIEIVRNRRPDLDFTGCKVGADITPVGWKNGSFMSDCLLTVTRDGKVISNIAMTLEYLPDSGYLTAQSMNIRASLSEQLEGYYEAARSSDGSATLYAKPNDKWETDDPLIIKWTFGTISFSPETISLSIDPRLELADLNGDGLNDLILYYSDVIMLNSDGQTGYSEKVKVFYGPTGAKSSAVNPLADFRKMMPEADSAGRYTDCLLIGDRIAARISYGKSPKTYAVITYNCQGTQMKADNIFVTDIFDLKAAGDGKTSLWRIGERKFLLVGDGINGEFETEKLCVSAPGSEYRPKIVCADFDKDGVDDAAVILTSDYYGGLHTEELHIVTSDGKIYKIDAPKDASELFKVETIDGGWNFSSKFGSFDVPADEFSSAENELSETPDLSKNFSYSLDGDRVVCELKIPGSDFSETSIRLAYQLDGDFKVTGVQTHTNGSPELTTDFTSMKSLITEIEREGKPRPDLVVQLTDRGSPTLRIRFDAGGMPYLVAAKAKGQLLIPEKPLQMVGNLSFSIFEAGEYIVVAQLYYDFGDTYIFHDGGIYENHTEYGQPGESYLSFDYGSGGLTYTRRSLRYNLPDMTQFGFYNVLDNITGLDDFCYEEGSFSIIDGRPVFTPGDYYTLSDIFDLDAEFEKYREYAEGCESIDDVIARNIKRE